MIRVICHENDFADVVNVGGQNIEYYKTFDVDLPEIEAWLQEKGQWRTRAVKGIELRAARSQEGTR